MLRGVGRGYMHGEGWYLTPRAIPELEEWIEHIPNIVRVAGINADDGFLKELDPLHIPANTIATVLIDRTFLTMGYPQLCVSGGKGSSIKLTYCEALFDTLGRKGHRDPKGQGRYLR